MRVVRHIILKHNIGFSQTNVFAPHRCLSQMVRIFLYPRPIRLFKSSEPRRKPTDAWSCELCR